RDRRHRTHAGRVRGCGARRASHFHGGARAAVAHRAAPRWRVAHPAQGGSGLERALGSFRRGRKLPDAGQARSRERQAALADQGAMKVRRRLLAALLGTAVSTIAAAQTVTPTLSSPTTPESAPAADGFIQRW